ncbi:hypothetical protein [Holophaga foetida]|uniref:hypothetical protein n=1 Tax=Holophaga foetida TaxID=35839 RepID=UPI00031427C9|nr:hypothetical protein [Holophaga foetida]
MGSFPWLTALQVLVLLLAMALLALFLTGWLGPKLGHGRALALWEAIPDLLWGGLALALWPAAWGPPAFTTLAMAFLLAALPGELRWLAQTLPEEFPVPAAWGREATCLSRRMALRHLAPRWLGARLPLWLTATLVLERLLGIRGPGSDWMMRVAFRDRVGMGLWLLGFASLWALFQREKA